jgi:hypothetical protein
MKNLSLSLAIISAVVWLAFTVKQINGGAVQPSAVITIAVALVCFGAAWQTTRKAKYKWSIAFAATAIAAIGLDYLGVT